MDVWSPKKLAVLKKWQHFVGGSQHQDKHKKSKAKKIHDGDPNWAAWAVLAGEKQPVESQTNIKECWEESNCATSFVKM